MYKETITVAGCDLKTGRLLLHGLVLGAGLTTIALPWTTPERSPEICRASAPYEQRHPADAGWFDLIGMRVTVTFRSDGLPVDAEVNRPDADHILALYRIPEKIEHLECDGASRVISQLLTAHHIEHCLWGGLLVDADRGGRDLLHFWIDLPDGRRIDYKARPWAGETAPDGLFWPGPYERFYRPQFTPAYRFDPRLAYLLAEIHPGRPLTGWLKETSKGIFQNAEI